MKVRWDRSIGRPEPIRALDSIREIECGEPLVRLDEAAPSAVILRDTVIPYLRESVAKMLEEAAKSLPAGLRLGVTDAWRPFERQKRIYDYMFEAAREAFPNRAGPALVRTVNRLCHPYHRKAPPGHCTGGAVDVNLIDERGETVDMWSPYPRTQAHPTHLLGLDPDSHSSRVALVKAMEGAGFSNCRDEWWHYSFGDAAWAVRVGASECRYGLVTLRPDEYEQHELRHAEAMKDRTNPFLAH